MTSRYPGERQFSNVYVAKCGRFTKIGASSNVELRMRALRAEHRVKVRLVRAWEVENGYHVEGTAMWLLAKDYKRERREWFRAPISVVVAAVEQAIEMVSAGNVAPFARERVALAKIEARSEAMRLAVEEFNAWAAANPVELEQLMKKMKQK